MNKRMTKPAESKARSEAKPHASAPQKIKKPALPQPNQNYIIWKGLHW
jgi:hypothetical protein